MLITKEQQEAWVDNYIKAKHTQDECIGFIDGIEKAMEACKNHELNERSTMPNSPNDWNLSQWFYVFALFTVCAAGLIYFFVWVFSMPW